MANNTRAVNLAIKAKDEYSKVMKDLQEAGRKAQLQFSVATKKALADTTAEIKKVSTELRELTAAENVNREAIGQLIIKKGKLVEKAAILKDNLTGVTTALKGSKDAAGSTFAAFDKTARSMDFAASKAERLRQELAEAQAQAAKYFQNQRLADGIGPNFGASNRNIAEGYASTARDLKRELAELDQTAARTNGTVRGSFAAFDRVAIAIAKANVEAQEQNALNSASVPSLNAKKTATDRNTAAQNQLAAATDRATAAQRRQNATQVMSGFGGALPGARQRNQGRRGEDQEVEIWGLKPWQLTNLGYQVNDVISGFAMGQNPIQIAAQQAGQFAQIWPDVMVGLARSIPIIAAVTAVLSPFIGAVVQMSREAAALEEFSSRLLSIADSSRYTAEGLMAISLEWSKLAPFISAGFEQADIGGLVKLSEQIAAITGQSYESVAGNVATAFSGGVAEVRELDKALNFLTGAQYDQILAMDAAGRSAEAVALAQSILTDRYDEASEKAAGPWSDAFTALGDAFGYLIGFARQSGVIQGIAGIFDFLGKSVAGTAMLIRDIVSVLPQPMSELEEVTGQIAFIEDAMARLQAQGFAADSPQVTGFAASWGLDLEALRARQAELQKIAEETAAGGTGPSAEDLKRQSDFALLIREESEAREQQARATEYSGLALAIYNNVLDLYNRAAKAGVTVTQEMKDAVVESTTAQFTATAAAEELAAAERTAAAFVQQHRTEEEKAADTIREMEAVIKLLTDAYGAQSPQVDAAKTALARFKAEATAATAQTWNLMNAAVNLGRALASLGSFDAELDTQLIRVENQIQALQNGIPESTFRADEMVRRETDALLAAGANPDTVAAAYEALMPRAQRLIELQQQSLDLQNELFNPTPESSGGTSGAEGMTVREEHEEKVNELLDYRKALLDQIKVLEDSGKTEEATALRATLADVNAQTTTAIDGMIAYLETMSGPEIEAAILNLRAMRGEITAAVVEVNEYLPKAADLNDQIAQIGGDGFGALSEALAEGKNAADAFFNSVLDGLGRMVIAIGEAIVQQAILNALTGGTGATTGTVGAAIANSVASIFHDGGIAGSAAPSRRVNPMLFANAMRFHSGGIPGLGPNEVPIIAENDEEILRRDDPRHRMNGGGSSQVNIKNVNVFDPADVIEAALATEAGERVMLNFMSRRSRTLKATLS